MNTVGGEAERQPQTCRPGTVLHLDMDAYFASIEQACNPSLRGKPVVVCGETSAEQGWGRTIVTTASYEARRFGIKTGCTVPEARRRCPDVAIVCGDPEKYLDTSRRLHRILLRYTDRVEVYSIDECFMDLAGTRRDPVTAAAEIKKAVRTELGLTCSIGVGPNKLIAKLAGDLQKPDGLVTMSRAEALVLFEDLPVQEVWGVGERTAERLARVGIFTAAELGRAPLSMLTTMFGVWGYRLQAMGCGHCDDPVARHDEKRVVKSVGHSHTLPKDTANVTIIQAYLRLLAERVGERLRRYGKAGSTVSLYVRYADFTGAGRQHRVGEPMTSGLHIYRSAMCLLRQYMPLRKKVRSLGISISALTPASGGQGFLLERCGREERLMDVVDRINRRYGASTLKPGSVLTAERFGVKERCGLIGTYLLDPKG